MSGGVLGVVERPLGDPVLEEEITSDGRVLVKGWAFDPGRPGLRVRARAGRGRAVEAAVDGLRDDIAALHPSVLHAGLSGFAALVPLPEPESGQRDASLVVEVLGASRPVTLDRRALPALRRTAAPPRPARPPPLRPRRPAAERVRALLVSHRFLREGAPRSLFEVGARLDRARFAVRVVTPVDGPLGELWREAGIATERVEIATHLPSVEDFEAGTRRLAALQARRPPDVVVANTLDAFWAVDLAAELGVPAVWIVRESVAASTYFLERLPVPIAERAAGAFARAARVIFVSRATAALFEGFVPRERVEVIPNGIDLAPVDAAVAATSRADARAALGLPAQRPIALCVGTTCQRKGQLVLLEATARLVRRAGRRPPPFSVLVGARPGPYLDALRAAIERLDLAEHARLVDEIPDPTPYYRAADCFACPSYQESLPRVLLEAMAFGLPSAASAVHGVPELVEHGRHGLLVPPGDPDALAGALEALLGEPSRAAALGAAARRRVEARFAIDGVVRRYESLLLDVLDAGGATAAPGA